MANITKRVSKKGVISYLIRISDGYENGKQQYISKTYTPDRSFTEAEGLKEAKKYADKLEEEIKLYNLKGTRKTFQELSEKYLQELKDFKDKKYTTVKNYERIAKSVYKSFGNVYIDKLDKATIQSYIRMMGTKGANKRTGEALSQKTQKNHLSYISTVFEYAIDENLIAKNPCDKVRTVHTPSTQREMYSEEEVKQILNAMLNKGDIQIIAMYNLFAFTGCRRAELMGFEFKDIDFKNNTITVNRTSNYLDSKKGIYEDTPKTKNGYRTIPLSSDIIQILKELKTTKAQQALQNGNKWIDTDRLFTKNNGQALSPQCPYRWLKKLCTEYNLTFRGLHSFRHTMATMLANKGVSIATLLRIGGWSSIKSVQPYINHTVSEADRQAMQIMGNLLYA